MIGSVRTASGFCLIPAGALLVALGACGRSARMAPPNSAVTPATHSFFPVSTGPHAVDCNTCHGAFSTFKQFDCLGCHAHEQAATNAVHRAVGSYTYSSTACYSCHQAADGGKQVFSHSGITAGCASCHAVGAAFTALPVAGFAHPSMNGADCAACHVTASWATVTGPAGLASDPARNVVVQSLIPSYSGTTIAFLRPTSESLPMPMKHSAPGVGAAAFSSCLNCHLSANVGAYYPGSFHSSLASLNLPQPASCLDCHAGSVPSGFVGALATSPARTPSSGEMKHDAVAWKGTQPLSTPLVPADCALCHTAPARSAPASWATGHGGSGGVRFHASLAAAGLPQPGSCLDCHANSRPAGLLTSANASLAANLTFDHASPAALGDCVSCHAANHSSSWSGGVFHLPGAPAPATCLPCHGGERPTSTAGWQSASYASIPFDYVGNPQGRTTHGDAQDCAVCHAGPGTGAFGGSQNWLGGHFNHDPAGVAGTTCIACHASQRPAAPITGSGASASFDHSINGTGDCIGCHQATVLAGSYQNYFNPSTHALPGGDWQGGRSYPGASLIGSPDQFITAVEITLTRSASLNLVIGSSSSTATLYNQMLHTSQAIPGPVNPGTSPAGDPATCWHCHTHDANGNVTAFSSGRFHASLANYSPTVNGAVSPLPQPTTRCADCHAQMRPIGIVERAASELQPMDHQAMFAAPVTIQGTLVDGAAAMECATCHQSPGATWADGRFHANIAGARPQDCTVCHYPLMADPAAADLASGASFGMRHRSSQLFFQNCQVCHGGALARGTVVASTSWQGGALHPSLSSQPAACIDCHAVSEPAPGTPTQSSFVYALAAGGTASNGGQWMNHGVSALAGKDCVVCHAADAKVRGSAWSQSDLLHGKLADPGSCQGCHGLTNGGGAIPGTKNNMPAGLTNSVMVSTAASDPRTGVAPGTLDQISHADVNVTGRDCNACHRQTGISGIPGIAGKEWAQAAFHASFSPGMPLTIDGVTGRCSNCHLNVRPAGVFGGVDHGALTSAPGSQDCASCHSFPGTGTAGNPNWLGASAAPQFIAVGGFTIPQPPEKTPRTQPGINNLPHPSVSAGTSCTTCHTSPGGGKQAIGYDHASGINTNCAACHEAGSNLVGTPFNNAVNEPAGAGDTRAFTLASLYIDFSGNSRFLPYDGNHPHFYPVDCNECHLAPPGIALATTGNAYLQIGSAGHRSSGAWFFPHDHLTPGKMSNPSTCLLCHLNGIPN